MGGSGVFFVVIQDNLLNKQSNCWWFGIPWRSCYATVKRHAVNILHRILQSFSSRDLLTWSFWLLLFPFIYPISCWIVLVFLLCFSQGRIFTKGHFWLMPQCSVCYSQLSGSSPHCFPLTAVSLINAVRCAEPNKQHVMQYPPEHVNSIET